MKTGGAFLTSPVCTDEIFTREQFSEEQKEIGQMVEKFARERIRPQKEEIEKFNKELSLELLRECGEMGLLSVDIPQPYGGLGLDKVTSAIVAEKLSMGMCASFATTFGAHAGIGTLPTVFFGNEQQKKKYLPKLATAGWIASYALTEPESGSDATSARTTARLSGDGKSYILNGTKQFITNASWATLFTTFANMDGKFTGFLIERDTPGLSIGPEEKKMGVKGSSTCSVYLENATVPVESVLGEVGSGAAIAFNTLNIGRFKLGAGALGGCKIVTEETLRYASQRRQFGQAIRNFDVIKGYFADMAVRTFALDAIVYRTIGLIDAAIAAIPVDAPDYNKRVADAIESYAIEASMCKVYGSESLAFVADTSVQIYGGYGFIEEYPLASVLRDTRIDRIWEGTNEINRQIIAGYVLKKALLETLPMREGIKDIKLQNLHAGSPVAPDDGLAAEKSAFEVARKLVLYTFNEAVSRYGQDLTNQQQVGALLSDMFTDIFISSSALSRVSQQSKRRESDPIARAIVKVLCYERIQALTAAAQKILHAVVEAPYLGQTMRTLNLFRQEMRVEQNIFRLKREIAEAVYSGLS
ncbi:MAG: acyl-CoA dehydrogenase family protein [bacterium]